MICGQGSSVNHTVAGRCALPRWCSRWACDDCRPVKLKGLIAQLIGGKPTLFLTLTVQVRADWTPLEAAHALSRAWAKFAAMHNRQHGARALQYMLSIEATEAGWPHLHILIRAPWISLTKLRAHMKAEIASPVLKLISLDGIHRVAAYVAKYIGKGPRQFGTMKRYWKTLDWLLPEFHEERRRRRRTGLWTLDPRSWQEIAFDAALRGFRTEPLNPGVLIHARAPP